ncbi:MAG: tyrosine-protein phosphatase [Chloroflexi bacterium]|nr:tyrosine-protein phosphatase [Chloroflexota bacterium]MBI5082616.1 tyrosine-protein phosphatase [Chloroflexota bacterium]
MLNRLYLCDVGGIFTRDGRRVRTNLLYRSSGLNPLRKSDRARLESLRLRHIVDLREPKVVRRQPDLFSTDTMTHLPVQLGAFESIKYRDVLMRRVNWDELAHPRLYADMLENNGDQICQFLNLLLDVSAPALVHCAVGKDRTGVFVSVLHLALGVPRDEVVKAYMVIKPHLNQHFPPSIRWLLKKTQVPELAYTVLPEYIEGMLDHVDEKYGDAENYLRAIGFGRARELREKFLENQKDLEGI